MLKKKLAKLTATWFYSGLSPFAPGTAGSLATLPVVFALSWGIGTGAVIIFAILISLIGIRAADVYAQEIKKEDPGCIVIDEVAGQSLALIAAGTNIWLFGAGFLLFRLFDISKPGPVGWADRNVKGGLGIMLDDIIAGIFAGIVVYLIKIYFSL